MKPRYNVVFCLAFAIIKGARLRIKNKEEIAQAPRREIHVI